MMYSYLMLQQKKTDTDTNEIYPINEDESPQPTTTCSCFKTLRDIIRSPQSRNVPLESLG